MNKFIFIYTLTIFSTALSMPTYACENHGSSYGFFSVYNDWSMRNRHMPAEPEVHVTNNSSSSNGSSMDSSGAVINDDSETNKDSKTVSENQSLENQNVQRKSFVGSIEP